MADNYVVLDGTGASLTKASKDRGSGVQADAVAPLDSIVVISPASPLTRPADTAVYAAGDLVANSTTAASVVLGTLPGCAAVNGGSGIITGLRLWKSTANIVSALFRVHFFRSLPTTITNGDNGALLVSGVGAHIGSIDIAMGLAFTDGAKGDAAPGRGPIAFQCATGSKDLYYAIEARANYTPASAETFTPLVEITQGV